MSNFTIAKVAVENTVYHFDKAFDYFVPADLVLCAKSGCRVMVPFGAANSKRQGIILELKNQDNADKIKPILAVLDQAPLLSNEALGLITWMKERYFCTLFDAAKLLLPTGINLKIKTKYSLLTNPADIAEFSEVEQQIITYLSHVKAPVEREKLLKAMGISSDSVVLEKLCKESVLVKSNDVVRQIADATQKMVRLIEDALKLVSLYLS